MNVEMNFTNLNMGLYLCLVCNTLFFCKNALHLAEPRGCSLIF